VKIADELNLTLASRNVGLAERVPMFGVPAHSLDGYVNQLVSKDYSVIIADGDTVMERNSVETEAVLSDEKEMDGFAIPDEPESWNAGDAFRQHNEITPEEDLPDEPDADLRLTNETLNAHHGQLDLQIQAFIGDNRVGVLYYSVFENVPLISFIEVEEDYRRQGIGTAMVQYLAGQYPGIEIEWGMLTDDGAAFKEAITYEVENEEYTSIQERIYEISEIISHYESQFAGDGISDEESEHWYELHDEQYDLENRLSEIFPVKTFIKEAGTESEPESAGDDVDVSGGMVETPEAAPRVKLIPQAPPAPDKINYRYSEADNLFSGGAKTKFRNNIEAIRLVKHLEAEGRLATADEQKMLANYVGWGGLSNAFSKTAAGW
jgi:GNAT superfamily N-acetyltransferase